MAVNPGSQAGAQAEEAALLALEPRPPHRSVRYGEHPSQVIDYYLPGGGRCGRAGAPVGAGGGPGDPGRSEALPGLREGPRYPCVTLLHGGFWREAYDRAHLSPLAAALARGGMAVALAEYRRTGGGGGWPATFEDVERLIATAWGEDGTGAGAESRPRSGQPHVLLGHSAGGHLALWAAARAAGRAATGPTGRAGPGGGPAGPVLDRVVAVAPVADLGRAHALGLSGGAVAELLGGPEAVPALLPETDPVRLPPPAVPVTLLHGTADPDVPIALSRAYTAAVRRAGGTAALWEQPGTGHFAALTPPGAAPAVPAPFAELLAALRGEPRPE